MAEAIAEAEAEGNMQEMEGGVMTTEQEVRTPKVDGLQVSPNQGGERVSMIVEGIGARPTRAEEIRRGKQPITQSQQERDSRPRQQQIVDRLRHCGCGVLLLEVLRNLSRMHPRQLSPKGRQLMSM